MRTGWRKCGLLITLISSVQQQKHVERGSIESKVVVPSRVHCDVRHFLWEEEEKGVSVLKAQLC